MSQSFSIEVVAAGHDRTGFSCGVEPRDRHFREQVSQDIKRLATACYEALEVATGKVAGYCTLAASGVPLGELPKRLVRKLPRYPLLPVARLGRLAVDAKDEVAAAFYRHLGFLTFDGEGRRMVLLLAKLRQKESG